MLRWPSTSVRRRHRRRRASTPARKTSATSITRPTTSSPPRSATGPRRRSSASTAAATTARPTTSGSTSGNRSGADAARRRTTDSFSITGPSHQSCVPARAAVGLAGAGISGFACRTAGFCLLVHQHVHRRGGSHVHQRKHRQGGHRRGVPNGHRTHGVDSADRDCPLCGPRGAAGVLHGQGRLAAGAPGDGGRGDHTAVGELPGQGLRMAGASVARGSDVMGDGLQPWLRADRHRRHADISVVALHGHSGLRGVRTRPGIAAGSIFTFSLSLGDYIAVTIVGGKTQMLGNIIYGQLVTANNQPLAAALSIIPLIAIIAYLLAMRRTGALENV